MDLDVWQNEGCPNFSELSEQIILQGETFSSAGNRYYLDSCNGCLVDLRPDLSEDDTEMWIFPSRKEIW